MSGKKIRRIIRISFGYKFSIFSESLFDPAFKVWTRFIEGELRITDKIQQQIMHVGSVCIQYENFLI
jgi:hypothetical protein